MNKFFEKFDKSRNMVWNGNEIVFEGSEIVKRWNAANSQENIESVDSVQQLKVSTMRILEEIQDRACKVGLPIGLSSFTDYIRSLYPEYYSERMAKTV